PQAGFDLTLDATGGGGNLIALGTAGAGTALSVAGPGTRMFWYPKKAALRAGVITGAGPLAGAEWNDANIGDFSQASGEDTVASGLFSIAGGYYSQATVPGSVAFGSGVMSSGFVSFVAGLGTVSYVA